MNKRLKVVFPGSFDPLTNGHLDIIERALRLFDEVVVGILDNPDKIHLFSGDERVKIIKEQLSIFGDKVHVLSFSGLLVNFLRSLNIHVVIRGLRAISDYDYETQLALMNRQLSGSFDVETIFLVTREENSYISSTMVKQIAELGGDVSLFVPSVVNEALKQKFKIQLGEKR